MYSVVAFDGQVYGPVDVRTLISWCQQGRVVASTHLVEVQTGRSFIAADMPELSAVLAQHQTASPQAFPDRHPTQQTQFQNPYQTHNPYPPQASYQPSQFPSAGGIYGAYGQPKSKTTALLWCFFLGGVGAHRFYLGHTKSAIAMLVIGLLCLVAGGFAGCILIVAIIVWSTIDFIRIASNTLPDASGVIPR